MGGKSFRFEILNDPKAFSVLEAGWESLCKKLTNYITVFASHTWYQNWWKYYSGDAKLHLFTMWQGDKLVGIAPLIRKKYSFHGLPVRAVGFIQNNESLHNDFIVMPQIRTLFLQKLIQSLFEQASQWDVLYFRNISPLSDNYKPLVDLLEAEGRTWAQKVTPYDTPYLIPSGNWQDYFAGRSRRTRKTLNNIRNKVQKAGKVSIKCIRTWDEFLSCKDDLFEVAQQSWTENIGGSLASGTNRDFYESLAYKAAAKGWLSVWALYLDNRMIAFEFHLRAFGREHAIRGHYHTGFASLSPGTYLEMKILEHIFQEHERIHVYDFCGAFDTYKKKWTDTFVPHCDLFVFNEHMYSRYIMFHEFKLVPFIRKTLQHAKLLR